MGKLYLIILSVFFILSVTTEWYQFLSIAISIIVLVQLMLKLGKGIALLEAMAVYSCIIYLAVPLLGYSVYTRENRISMLWHRVMPVDFNTYYSFILPSIIAYLAGLFLIVIVKKQPDEGDNLILIKQRIKDFLGVVTKNGLALIVTGVMFFFIKRFIPASLAFIGNMFYLFVFVGILYVHYQPNFKGKLLVYCIVSVFIFWDAINTGMFTVLIYMGITMASFFVAGKKIPFLYKLIGLIVVIFFVLILQLVKGSFRKKTWKRDYAGSRIEVFQNLAVQQTQNINMIFSEQAFFPVYARLNQGWTTALVMRRIPNIQPYDNGESIIKSVAASVVPRVLWPDKPEAGGVYNMGHFAGFKLRGWSTNIGPVGEAYGNFGPVGGIVYMFFFGLFIGYIYYTVFRKARNIPVLILWFPLLFFETMFTMENDTLQALNSLMKASFFIWMIYKLFPQLFKLKKADIA